MFCLAEVYISKRNVFYISYFPFLQDREEIDLEEIDDFPTIILIGSEPTEITEIAIAMDGKLFMDKLTKCCPVEAVVVILAMFNALNLAFPKGLRCVYQFLDIQVLKNTSSQKNLASTVIDLIQNANL